MPQLSARFFAARLREAREARSIPTQLALAGLAGVGTSSISRWEDERSNSSPPTEIVLKLSSVLGVRPSFFFRPPYEHGGGATFFRSLANAKKRDLSRQQARLRWVQELAIVVQHYVDLPAVDLPGPENPAAAFRSLRDDDIERIAGDLRERWQLGDRPIPDIVRVMERAGIVVATDEMGTISLDGLCNWSDVDGRPYVLLAQDKMSFFRRQMDAAHELGHAALHRGITESELRTDFDLVEKQAFRLASAFLMPASAFALTVGPYPTLQSLLALKDRWHVSVKAMIHRCRDLDLIEPADAVQLYKYYSAKRWTRGEPLDDSVPTRKPQMLAEAIQLIVSSGTRTKEDLLANEFTIPARDIEDLTGLGEGWFSHRSAEVIQLRTPTTIGTVTRPQSQTGVTAAITRLRQTFESSDERRAATTTRPEDPD